MQNGGSRNSALTLNGSTTALNLSGTSTTFGSLAGSGTVFNSGGANTLTVGFDNTSTTFSGQLSRFNDATLNATGLQKIGTGVMTMTGVQLFVTGTTGTITVNGGTIKYLDSGAAFPATTVSGGATITVNNGGTLALDNTGTANVNSRLGMSTAGTLNIQGGKLTINGTSTAATPTTETITTFNVTNGGGRVELTPNAANALNLAITTLNTANGTGSLVIGGINGSAVGTVGQGVLTITTPNLIAGQGTGLNGTTTMAVRHDILGDAAIGGLGTGFLVKDTAAGGTYRALASGELASAILLPLATGAATTNVGLTGATQALTVNSLANTLTISGASTINGLGATFGNYGPGGGLLTLSLSNAAASLTLAGATGNINVGAFGSTTAGTTPYVHVITGGTLNVNGAFAVNGTAGLLKADGGALNLNNFAYYTGATTINDGTLKLASGAANTIAVVPTAGGATVSQVNLNGTGAILDLNGQSQAIGTLTSINPLPGQGGTIQNAGAAATLTTSTQAASGTFGGVISGNIALTRAGANTTTLTNANTYTGATIVRGGTLQLRDSGSISSTAGLTLNYGTLNWDNFGLNTQPNPTPTRVAATNAVTLQGGTITINGAGSTDTVVTLNSVTATGGNNTVNILPFINEGSTAKLTIGSLVRSQSNHSGVNFNGFSANNSTGTSTTGGQGLTANGQIILNSLDFSMANAVTTAASNIVTVPSTAGLFVGALVTGTGLPANERITAITSATTFTVTTGTGVTAQASTTVAATSPLINLTLTGGSTVAASNIVTVPSTTGLFVGAPVTGTGLPASEFITAITSGTTFTVTTGTGVTAGTGTTFTANNLNNNLIGGWAVADGSTFATYVSGNGVFTNNGVSVMGQTTQGIVAPGFTGTTVAGTTLGTGNYSEAGAAISLTAGPVVANSWRFVPGATQAITFPTTTTVALNVGVIANAAFTTTLTATDATNTISGTGTDLFFYVNQNTLVVQPAITGTSALVSNGPSTLRLAPTFASNTYTGGTFINGGTTNLQAGVGFIAIPGALTINNATVTLGNANSGQIAATSAVTINGGGALNLFSYTVGTSQTLDSITFNNEGGTGNPTVSFATPTALSTLTLSNANAITATNNSIATTPTISTAAATFSALSFGNASPVITVNAGLAETGLNISAPIANGAFTTLSKSGAGVLALSGASTFTTGFNLNQGGLMFGAGSTGGPVTSGPVGTGTLVIAGGTSLLSDGTVRTIGNATTVNGDFTFGGRVAGNGVILSGAMNLGATGRTITVTSPAVTSTINGVITGATTGTALTKAGAGTLVLGAANSFANVAITGGILKNGIDNAIPATSAISVAVGTGYDLNNFNETLDSISGLGFITQSGAATKTLTVSSTVNSSTFSGIITDNNLGNAASRLALTKVGTPTTLTLAGANTYTGLTTVTSGILSISNGSALGTVANGTVVTAGGSLELQNNIAVTGAEALTITGTGSTGTNGALRNLSGANSYSGTVTLGAGGATIISDALSTLTLNGTTAVAATTQPLSVGGAGNTTISGNITGTTAVLTKSDAGTLLLSGTNTITGVTTILGGTLAVANGAAIANTGAVVVANAAGATFRLDNSETIGNISGGGAIGGAINLQGNTLTTGDASNTSFSGVISGALGGLTKVGTGNFTLDGTVANTFTGLTTVTNGTLTLGKTTVLDGAIAGPATAVKGSAASILVNGGTLNWAANDQVGNNARIDITSGAINFGTFNETIFDLVNSGGTVDYGTGTVFITDPTWNSGTNTISGNTTFGVLNVLGGTNTINAGASLTAGSSGGVNFQGTGTTPNVTITSDATTPGVMKLAGNVTVDSTVTSASITSGGVAALPGRLDLNGANRTFTVNNGGAGLNVSAQIIGGAGSGLTKAGTGTMTVSANNTYTGATAVTGGTLNVTGSLSGTTSVNVNGGGTLLMAGGSNNIGSGAATPDAGFQTFNSGSPTYSGGANVSLGDVSSTGTLAVAGTASTHTFGTLTLNGNAILDFSSGGGAHANVNLFFNGALVQNGNTLTINNWNAGTSAYGLGATTDLGTFGDLQDRLLFTSSLGFGQGTLLSGISFNLPGLGNVGAQEVAFGSNFEIVPVPEPATTALIGSVALCALIGYRERRRFTGIRNRLARK